MNTDTTNIHQSGQSQTTLKLDASNLILQFLVFNLFILLCHKKRNFGPYYVEVQIAKGKHDKKIKQCPRKTKMIVLKEFYSEISDLAQAPVNIVLPCKKINCQTKKFNVPFHYNLTQFVLDHSFTSPVLT